MASVKLVLDTRSTKKDGTHPVKLYITHKGAELYVSTNISVSIENWLGNQNKIEVKSWPTSNRFYNEVLNQLLVQSEALLLKMRADGKLENITKKELKSCILKNSPNPDSDVNKDIKFIEYYKIFLHRKDKKNTIEKYKYTLTKIAMFDNLETLLLRSISIPWLRQFEGILKEQNLSANTIATILRNIRAIFNQAIDDEVIDQNNYPFRKFKIKTEKTVKRSLTVEQLRVLRDYECQEHQAKYRDMFMLIFYLLGINMVDLANLKTITDGRIEFRRAKTGRLYSMKVEPEAMEIIEKYRGQEYLLNICDSYANYKDFLHRLNNNLKQIGTFERKGRGGKKVFDPLFPSLTTYWARHTWATIAASLDIPKETIAAALGHGGNSVTDIYIDFDQRKVDQANRKVIDYLRKG